MDISEFTVEELQEEISRRKEKERLANKPQPLVNPDLIRLKRVVGQYIEEIYNEVYGDSDISNYIFEEAVKAIYGKKIFNWINKNV